MKNKEIIQTVIQEMKEKDMKQVDLSKLMSNLGINEANKDDVVLDLMTQMVQTCERYIVEEETEGIFFEQLEGFIRRVMDSDILLINRLLHLELGIAPETKCKIKEAIKELYKRISRYFAALLEQGRMEGKIRRTFNELETSMIAMMIISNGATYREILETNVDEDTFVITLLDIVMRLIR